MPSKRFDYYLDQAKQFHAESKAFSGRGVLKHAPSLIEFSRRIRATNALDYGCGKGNQYTPEHDKGIRLEEKLGYTVTKFDPAVPKFNTKPTGTFDLVWCTDVLEHIPEEDIPWVIQELDAFATKGLFITVGTYPAKKSLPNGENAHVCVKPAHWWCDQFAANMQKRDGFVFNLLVD
jgi:hypothetical protein